MSLTRELISKTTRGQFRDLTTGSTVGRISSAFQDEGFVPNPDSTWDDGSQRRTTAQHYLEAVDWTDPRHVGRALRAMAVIRGRRVAAPRSCEQPGQLVPSGLVADVGAGREGDAVGGHDASR
jgi:hypothetical protein